VSSVCNGVDPNRNFAFNWLKKDETGDEGASRAPCSDTYAGKYPFSEPETIAVEAFMINNREKFDVYLSFHSYAHQILFPFGHSRTRIVSLIVCCSESFVNELIFQENFEENQAIGDAAAARLKLKHGTEYEVGSTIETLYAASGVSVDHAYGHHKIPIAYTYEMRGSGTYGNFGFFLPSEFIVPNGEEVLESLIALVAKAREFGYVTVNP
jgi:Zinc carboxypeptidase